MTKISKRHFNNKNLIDPERKYDLQEAIAILKDATNAKFEESIDVAINLGIDGKQSEQNVRGSALLPNGSGKNLKVIVFAEGEDADAANKAGADDVGMDDLAEKIKSGYSDFELVIATPSSMKIVGQCSIGKLSFPDQAIKENFISLIEEVKKNRPSSSKGVFIKMITLSSTMGPGLKLNES